MIAVRYKEKSLMVQPPWLDVDNASMQAHHHEPSHFSTKPLCQLMPLGLEKKMTRVRRKKIEIIVIERSSSSSSKQNLKSWRWLGRKLF